MTTLSAFNTMLKSFLEELAEVYPEEKSVGVFLAGFDALVATNARMPMDLFVGAVSPHADAVMSKDPSLFAKLDFGGIDMGKLWAQPDVSDATRDAIWQYLHTLMLLGTTVSSVPAELLQSIESVAANCAEKIQGGDMDFASMTKMLMGGLGGMLGGVGGVGGVGGGSTDQQLDGGGAGTLSKSLRAARRKK